jgi:hypothetical protein
MGTTTQLGRGRADDTKVQKVQMIGQSDYGAFGMGIMVR